jgi:putative transposase
MYGAGEKPSATELKAKWHAIRQSEFPWSLEVTKCAGTQAVLDLGQAFANFFRDLKQPKGQRRARYPRFKKKKGLDGGFALCNDQIEVVGDRVRVPLLGWVEMRETLRFNALGAAVVRSGAPAKQNARPNVLACGKASGRSKGRASAVRRGAGTSVQVDDGNPLPKPARGGRVVGIDLARTSA